MTDIREYLRDHVLIFDGAFGTYYSQRIDQASGSCELANVDHPDLVGEIHREYLIAGAQALKTNTFGAYASLVGGPEKQAEIIWKGLSLAEEALRDYRELDSAPGNRPVYIFADLGPAPGDTPEQKAEQYIKAAELFLQAGAKHFLFETQTVTDGLVEATRYIKKQRPDAFILMSFGVLPDGYSTTGQFYRQIILEVLESGYVDLAGLNCVSSPGHMAKLLGKLPEELLFRIAAMPNAGYPVVRGFRTFFDGSAKYFQGTMKRFLDMGIRVLGGCCGTTPDYIRGLAELAADQVVVPHDYTSPYQGEGENPREGEAYHGTINCLLTKLRRGKRVIAVELDSPRNAELDRFMEGAKRLQAAGVDTLTIADCPIAQARMDSTLLACKVKRELDLDVIPHMTCRDRNVNATKALLLGGHAEGIRNVLVITGDPIPTAERDEVKTVYQFNSRKLMSFVSSLNQEEFHPDPYGIFGALNVNARNFSVELDRAKEKMENGCMGFLTQPVLTEQAIQNLKQAKAELEGAYILAGLIPVISERNGRFMDQEINGISVPEEMIESFHGLDREQGEALGRKYVNDIYHEIKEYTDGVYLMTPFQRIGLMEGIVRDLLQE
ncbi:MAG: bifunctional homocysteine S-methyltransferase/methylenetetrahydrofolate reductase [Lachnospiraceae bacterium]|nr:bifunctional homocysteine S-methyltransferase/methylenetetrahydrofolate reductase [Lachnospiraceae bacterium]